MPKVSTYTLLTAAGIDRANDSIYVVDATGPSSKRATVASLWDAGLTGAHTLLGSVTFTGASFNWTLSGFGAINLSADFPKIVAIEDLLIQTQQVTSAATKSGQPLITDGTTVGIAEFGDLRETVLVAVTATLTAGRALTDSDHGTTLIYSGSGNVTVTVSDTLRNDFHARIVQMGTGKVTVGATGSGVVNGPQGHLSTGHQYSTIEVRSISPLGFVISGHVGA
jgi:hypothetical protein